jgi:lysophospholipase L1-like esterase
MPGGEASPPWVFLGDSITDGHTLILLVEQALDDAGVAHPPLINAGASGDTAEQMLARLERDVLVHRPALVAISAGINDALRGVAHDAYTAAVTALTDRCRAVRAEVLLLTTTILDPRHQEARLRQAAANTWLRRFAAASGSRLAEVHGALAAAPDGCLADDGIHLELPGYHRMATAVLAAVGHAQVAIAQAPRCRPLPNLLRHWRIRPADGHSAFGLVVPEAPEPSDHWWPAQERARGYAHNHVRSGGHRWLAETDAGPGRLRLGGAVDTVTLDGRELWHDATFRGWHHGHTVLDLPHHGRLTLAVTGPFIATCE